SPHWPTVFVAVAAVVYLAVAVGVELAMRPRWRGFPAIPCLLGMVSLIAVSAPDGPQWVAATTSISATILLLWIGLDDRIPSVRWTLPVVLATVLAAGLASVGVAWSARADPRQNESADTQLSLLDPLAGVAAQRQARPPRALFDVTSNALAQLTHWRTGVLDEYNGEAWTASGQLSPGGNRVATTNGLPEVSVRMTALTSESEMWALPGSVLQSSEPVETDAERRAVRIVGPRPADNTFVVEPIEPFDAAGRGTVATVSPSELETSFVSFARQRSGGGTLIQRVASLAGSMREDYRLDSESPGGVQLKSLDFFLKDARVGNREQFVAAFVVLARSLGIDARIATGYVLDPPDGNALVITTAEASAWPEVRVDDRWVTVDVVPPEDSTGQLASQGQVSSRTPQAVQPAAPVDVAPDPVSNPVDDSTTAVSTDRLAALRVWSARVGVFVGVAGFGLLVFALVVRTRKRLRRRGLRSSDAGRRIGTAWILATDALVDAGAALQPSQTNAELADVGAWLHSDIGPPFHELKRHADASTFTTLPVDHQRAFAAIEQLLQIESIIRHSSSVRWRCKWLLSTRSLRRRTQSPLRSSRI
ncbi:MAG: transglutaminase-like domain-containing protein, partial [Ilumatobacteraceae bacterium]